MEVNKKRKHSFASFLDVETTVNYVAKFVISIFLQIEKIETLLQIQIRLLNLQFVNMNMFCVCS